VVSRIGKRVGTRIEFEFREPARRSMMASDLSDLGLAPFPPFSSPCVYSLQHHCSFKTSLSSPFSLFLFFSLVTYG